MPTVSNVSASLDLNKRVAFAMFSVLGKVLC